MNERAVYRLESGQKGGTLSRKVDRRVVYSLESGHKGRIATRKVDRRVVRQMAQARAVVRGPFLQTACACKSYIVYRQKWPGGLVN